MNLPTLHTVPFHGDGLVTFEHDDEKWIAMRPVVENLELDWPTQYRKIKADPRFKALVYANPSAGGVQEMLSIPLRKFPGWLTSVNPNKIPDVAKRAKVILYQDESFQALYDYWFRGAAVRSDMDGLVTALTPKVMTAIGGMVKGIVHKALVEEFPIMLAQVLPTLVEREVLRTQGVVIQGWTAGDVIREVLDDRKGTRGLPRWVSNHLRRYHARKGIPVRLATLGSSTAYVFDPGLCREWLGGSGRLMIERAMEERRGQGRLRLVPRK